MSVREAKSATGRVTRTVVLGFPQVEHLFKTGGLCITSYDFNRWRYCLFVSIERGIGSINIHSIATI